MMIPPNSKVKLLAPLFCLLMALAGFWWYESAPTYSISNQSKVAFSKISTEILQPILDSLGESEFSEFSRLSVRQRIKPILAPLSVSDTAEVAIQCRESRFLSNNIADLIMLATFEECLTKMTTNNEPGFALSQLQRVKDSVNSDKPFPLGSAKKVFLARIAKSEERVRRVQSR